MSLGEMTPGADNGSMATLRQRLGEWFGSEHPNVEPGLLRIFRWYVAIRLGFGILAAWAVSSEPDPSNPRFPEGGVFFFGLLLVLLLWPWAQRKLGKWFLPVAIVLATLGPSVEPPNDVLGGLDDRADRCEHDRQRQEPFTQLALRPRP